MMFALKARETKHAQNPLNRLVSDAARGMTHSRQLVRACADSDVDAIDLCERATLAPNPWLAPTCFFRSAAAAPPSDPSL
jgi:hypothetical protein